MSIDAAILAGNRAERERLRKLVTRLSDEDLTRPMSPHWTVAAALVHLAFWDRRAQVLLTRWEKGEELTESPMDVHTTNDTVTLLTKRLPPRAAADEAVAAAEAIDGQLEAAPADLIDRFLAAGGHRRLFLIDRAEHRREHLDEIEQSLAR